MSATYKRILLKISGEALAGGKEYGIDPAVASFVADEIREIFSMGVQVGVVVGGGNIFRGVAGSVQGVPRITGDSIGMLATVINALILRTWLEKAGVGAVVLSALAVEKAAETYTPQKAIAELELGRVAIMAAGTGNPFFTTDTAAALRCAEISAEALFKATKVDGVYDRDPVKHTDATRFASISYADALARKLGVMDLTAMSFCMENQIPIIVFKMMDKGNLRRCVEGRPVGSIIKKEA